MSFLRENKPLRMLVAPGSFKGNMPAAAVATSIARGIREAVANCIVVEVPIADDGEGSASVIAQGLQRAWAKVDVVDANGRLAAVSFAACCSPVLGKFSLLDVAEIVGLPAAIVPPGARTSRGVGQAIARFTGAA